ncbi:MAG: hypothetical protein AMS21_13025 [Gemmatimonas sp. SG8_38_2]|nr:MAG: hypothetical protein AMS21_13025 [Gemmatimonas sp. SG8_38_2]
MLKRRLSLGSLRWTATLLPSVLVLQLGCSDRDPGQSVLIVELPLHLEEHLDAAQIVGSETPSDVLETIEWHFNQPQPDWKAFDHFSPHNPLPLLEQTEDALRVTLTEANQYPGGDFLHGDISVGLPDLTRSDWSHVLIRARASEDIINFWFVPKGLGVGGQVASVVNDGNVQT